MKFSLNNANIGTHFGIEITDYCGKDNPFNMDCAIAKFRNKRYPWKINHNFQEMFFILEGECVIEFQNETIILEKGDVYIIPPGEKTLYTRNIC